MSLFDRLVDEALRGRADFSSLRPVVEKELLHHDILREMSEAGLLAGLTLIGGTCLRACYGSSRLSEDLVFTGGSGFRRRTLAELGSVLRICKASFLAPPASFFRRRAARISSPTRSSRSHSARTASKTAICGTSPGSPSRASNFRRTSFR